MVRCQEPQSLTTRTRTPSLKISFALNDISEGACLKMYSKLETAISAERMGTYLIAAGFSEELAMALYAWNMKLSASFMPLFCSAEVCLRNRVEPRLADVFGPIWWEDSDLHEQLGGSGWRVVQDARRAIQRLGVPVTRGRMTAELSFGFWENMLLPKYQTFLWSPIHPLFPDLSATVDQAALFGRCTAVRALRNRIAHHEPIIQRNITQDFADCLGLIGWLSNDMAAWIKPHCDVMRLLRQKP